MKIPRTYQDAANKSLFKFIFDEKNKGKHPLIVAPVAAGKSLMIAEFIKDVHKMYSRTRVVILTHTKELLAQDAKELMGQYPDCDFGFYCASLCQKKLHNDVTFASIKSIHSKVLNFNRVPEIIIIDEVHLVSHDGSTQYRKFIDSVLEINPNCKVVGYTGTPFRSDTGRLDEGDNRLFDSIAYEISMDFMIEEGYWAKPVCPNVATNMDVSGVAIRGSDYVSVQLEEAINTEEINYSCVKETLVKGKDRKKWLVFTAGVQHAENVYKEFVKAGINTEVITDKTSKTQRDEIIKRFRRGDIRCLVNVAILTTGFDVPDIDLIVFMRPTRSVVLYIQIVGRGVRPVYADGYDLLTKEGRLASIAASIKPDCMILDFGGVVKELGPIDKITIKKSHKEKDEDDGIKGETITKICPSCGIECFAGQRYCYECSYCFIVLDEEASNRAIVSRDEEPEWLDVIGVFTGFHQNADSSYPSMKVSYATMKTTINEWICFEHHKFEVGNKKRYAWEMACQWHKYRRYDIPPPKSVVESLDIKYPEPSRILVRKKGKFWKILKYDFKQVEKEDELDDDFEIPF